MNIIKEAIDTMYWLYGREVCTIKTETDAINFLNIVGEHNSGIEVINED
jgi:hypothetical protein